MSDLTPEKLNEMIPHARLLREHYLADPHRPGYHFLVPEGCHCPVDPNATVYWNGRYHFCYIYQHEGAHYWGHASSLDLLHWRHHAPALAPGEGDEGIFSGGVFVDGDKVVVSYWRLGKPDGIAIATSSDPNLDHWTRHEANPVIVSEGGFGWTRRPAPDGTGMVPVGSADPSAIWRKDGRYYMLTGNLPVLQEFGRQQNLPEYQGDTLYLFVSDDLANWTYLHKFYESRREWTRETEDDMCPDFFPLPASPEGGPDSGKHMILFISHNMGCQYYIGEYANDRFAPESHGRMTWVDNEFFAPESVVDPAGRRIMWTWVFDRRSGEERAVTGWSGEMSLPRLLWLGADNSLRMRPVPELERLRFNARTLTNLAVPADGQLTLPIRGDSLELNLEFRPGLTGPCGLKVRQSPDGEEETVITYDPAEGALKINTQKSCLNLSYKMIESGPLSLAPGEPLSLRVFLDKSFVEVFANDRQAVVRRIYPSRPDSQGISLFSSGGPATVTKLDAWDMMPSNPY